MKKLTIGILAHVDAGKTTLSEAILYRTGVLRNIGRVDHGDTALDYHSIERERGITVYSAQAVFDYGSTSFTLLDTPGHVDFSAEMERTLQVLDCAVLLISGTDGIQAHTETLWHLLKEYGIPVFLFVTKMDLETPEKAQLLSYLNTHLDSRILDFSSRPADEEIAMFSEELLDRYMEQGFLEDAEISSLIRQRELFPCYFGSGLKLDGIEDLLSGLDRFAPIPDYLEEFAAKVFKITYDNRGVRLSHIKLTGGTLQVRAPVRYLSSDGKELEEKITGIRVYCGTKFDQVDSVSAGSVCTVTGLTATHAGQGLGAESDASAPYLAPAFVYHLTLPEGVDDKAVMPKLKQLEEEDPLLRFYWNEQLKEIHLHLMGPVQIEVLQKVISDRFDLDVKIGTGKIQYKETIASAVEGTGHYEPLRHYAEVHLLMEPLSQGSGLEFETDCPTDSLDINWQRLILTHLAEKQHLGVLTGSPLTDVRFTLIAGRAHLKHTEGGDFRQATYRAVRQGLMKADSILLEPYYSFQLEVPLAQSGRAITDLRNMHGSFAIENTETSAIISGTAPVSCLRNYNSEVAAYTGGKGRFSCCISGYCPCHNPDAVIEEIQYNPEQDLDNSPDSVFCSHGAGTVIKWDKVDEFCHIDTGFGKQNSSEKPRLRMGNLNIDEKELEAIMNREFGPIKRPMYQNPVRSDSSPRGKSIQKKKELLVVDGYNVIFAWNELKELAADNLDSARHRLCDILVNYYGFTGSNVVLVFDGYAVKGNPGEKSDYHGVHVVYTQENESADIYIEKLLAEIGKNYSVRVVTSDRLIRLSALGSGILRTSSREFGNEMDWIMEQIAALLKKSAENSHTIIASEGKL